MTVLLKNITVLIQNVSLSGIGQRLAILILLKYIKNTLINFNTSNVQIQSLVLLPVDWDKNYLLITKWLLVMIKVFDYSHIRTITNSFEIQSKQ